VRRSACPRSRTGPRWTAPSSTGTATCSSRSTPARPSRRRRTLRRLAARIRQLEHRLSQALGEQAWRESGLGQPDDIRQLKQQITQLTEDNQQLRAGLAERDQDLAAARAANRELMARLNTRS